MITTNIKAIDFILVVIEKKADKIGYDIENNKDYLNVCNILTEYEWGTPITSKQKAYMTKTIKALCKKFEIDLYEALFSNL